jgi:uncharacterized protein YjiS (DUF1127 family)
MAHTTHVLSNPRPISLSQSVASFVKREWTTYQVRRAKRATARILFELDDATLRDIGLSRSEVDSVVYGMPRDRQVNYNGR